MREQLKRERLIWARYRRARAQRNLLMVIIGAFVVAVLVMCTVQLLHTDAEAAEREFITEMPVTYEMPQTEPKRVSLGEFRITGYVPTCEHCCNKSDGIGANGEPVIVGKHCAASKEFDFGQVIYIEGLGEYTVTDRGVGKGCIDIACASHEECYKITRYAEVEI